MGVNLIVSIFPYASIMALTWLPIWLAIGGVVPASLRASLDERIDGEGQLQRQSQAIGLMSLESSRQQAKELLLGAAGFLSTNDVCDHVGIGDGAPFGAPFRAQIALDGVRKGDKQTDRPLDILLLSVRERAIGVSRGDEDRSGEVTKGGGDGRQRVAAVPEAIVGGLVAEDEDETDDDGQRGDLGRVISIQAGCRSKSEASISQRTIVGGTPTVSNTCLSSMTTMTVKMAWPSTGSRIAPWMAPLMNRRTSGHLHSNPFIYALELDAPSGVKQKKGGDGNGRYLRGLVRWDSLKG